MNYYSKELQAIKKSNRLRTRKIFEENLIDLASNDYLGLASNKELLSNAYQRVVKEHSHSPKASMLVNGYSNIHKEFEEKLSFANKFEDAIIVGSGFLANISLIEALVRKKDILFIDEDYHASGILASKLTSGQVVVFKHNNFKDLEEKIINNKTQNRAIIAIEGVYSMRGDIAPKEFNDIANKYNAILLVDEAHSSGVIGKNLLGWFDYFDIKPELNHIKMGTLGKAYGSYGAYILASKHIISYLINRAKPIIYSTAPSLFDTALGLASLEFILNNKDKLYRQIKNNQEIVKKELNIDTPSLIAPLVINDNKKVLDMQEYLKKHGFIIGAIRQPTVPKAIIRIIIKLDISTDDLKKVSRLIKEFMTIKL